MEVKIGQVYESELGNFTITIASEHLFCVIREDGKTATITYVDWFKNYKLLAEYPTWQEAVNSKEFKGENK